MHLALKRYVILVFFLLATFAFSHAAYAFWGPEQEKNLAQAVLNMVEGLVKQGTLQGKTVLISANAFFETNTGASLPLALYLREKSIAAFRQAGVTVLLPGGEFPKYKLIGQWTKSGENLSVSFNVIQFLENREQVAAAATAEVPLATIAASLLQVDTDAMARYLVEQLDANLDGNRHQLETKTVHLRPFVIHGQEGAPALGPYLSDMLRPALAQSQNFLPLDSAKQLRAITPGTLRERSKIQRGIRPQAKKAGTAPPEGGAPPAGSTPAQPMSLAGAILQAQVELLGDVYVFPDLLEIRTHLNDHEGRQISAASMKMPRTLVPTSMFRSSKLVPSGLSNNDLLVEITTSHGEGKTVYHKDEAIRFVVRVNRRAYIYVFDIDAKGTATLLYPLGNSPAGYLEGGIPLILPDDGLPYDLIVGPPYGRDTVLVVASEERLNFLAPLSGDWSSSDALRTRLRQQGFSKSTGYAESEVVVVTKP